MPGDFFRDLIAFIADVTKLAFLSEDSGLSLFTQDRWSVL
jgi:hypothetical protein